MKILDYLLYAFGKPCSHYIPTASSWHKNRKKVHELDRMEREKNKAITDLEMMRVKVEQPGSSCPIMEDDD